MSKVNYTAQPFSPNDKPANFESFDPESDVKQVGKTYFFVDSDSLNDTDHQINKLPSLIWRDYSEFTEGDIARAARMYERALASVNRSEIAHEWWQIAGTAALGGLIGALPGIATHYACHNLNNQLTELAVHIVGTTGIIAGMHAATEFALNPHNEHVNTETKEMITQARNQGKKAQVSVIEWRENTNDPMAAELEAQLDATIQSYEQAFKETEASMQHNPWWKVSGTAAIGGLVGAVPGALSYLVGTRLMPQIDDKTVQLVSGVVATTGMIAGMHAVTEIMRPQHVNMTSKETAEELSNARNLVRKSYADAVTFRRKLASEQQAEPAAIQTDVNRAALEQVFTKEADKNAIPALEIDTSGAERHGALSPKLPTMAVAH